MPEISSYSPHGRRRSSNSFARMSKVVSYFPLLALCIAASGCFPYHYTTRPGVSGTVVSAGTHEPLGDASVSFGRTNNSVVAFSTADGSFVVPPKRQWWIWFIPQDVFPLPCTVCVRHPGYESNSIQFTFSAAATGKAATRELGVISLNALSQ